MRVFDQGMSSKVIDLMEEEGVKTMSHSTIEKVVKLGEKNLEVDIVTGKEKSKSKHRFESVLVAIGRDANPEAVNARAIDLQVSADSGKFIGRKEERERSWKYDHIYFVGDTVEGVPELMPVAQKSGKLLARRVFHRLHTGENKLEEN
mmetsp:Transcript_9841/g.7410  ORF Transcript_9841/g.7410 Transcript_9841/m.7410 type:complete len:148 (-) Transcript_9841:129-572(-)